MSRDPDTGEVLIPDLMNVSGSGHFYNKTDAGITVHRRFTDDTVIIRVNKIKFKHLGRIGEVVMLYNLKNGRYQEREDVNENGWDDSNWLHKEEQIEIEMPNIPAGEIERRFEQDSSVPF